MAKLSAIPEEFKVAIRSNHSMVALAQQFEVSRDTVYRWKKIVEKEDVEFSTSEKNKYDILSDEAKTIYRQSEEIKSLRLALAGAQRDVHLADEVTSLVYKLAKVKYKPQDVPNWINKPVKNQIIPVFCLSDTHIGSVINPADVNFVNEYNVDIAKTRIYQLTNDFIDIYKNKMSNYTYPGIVVLFGGDMIENAMHGTEETNELTVVDQVIEATNILITVVDKLAKAFGKVTIFAVSGNHGRLVADKYVKNTDRLGNSLEKIVYHFINIHFKDNEDVTLITRQSDIIHFEINGKTWRLEHGDGISYTGQAISGPLNSFERGRLKRNGVDGAIGRKFDYLVFGHFHQHLISNTGLVVMDSTKGYDSYVMRMSLPFNTPGATTFSINGRGDLIFATNLKCRDGKPESKSEFIKIY